MHKILRSEAVEEQRTGAKRRGEGKQGGEGQDRSGLDKIEKRAEAHIALTIVGGRKKS